MIGAVRFLELLGQLLEVPLSAETEDRAELLRTARSELEVLRLADPESDFILSSSGISWGPRPLDPPGGVWFDRLLADGVGVLAPPNDETGFARWVARLAGRITEGATMTIEREMASVGAAGAGDVSMPDDESEASLDAPEDSMVPEANPDTTIRGTSIQDESDGVWLIHEAAAQGRPLSFKEVTAIAARLAGLLDQTALAATPQVICTLDEYTSVHSLNVALLSMKLARHLAFDDDDLLAVGIAGLLHDIGKVRLGDLPAVSREMLSSDERGVLQAHTVEGARLLMESGASFAVAAVVAYEHHMSWQGEGGYPARHFERSTHPFSRLVAVCDAYDVLCSERSFRPALSAKAARKYLGLLAGQGLDPEVTGAFRDVALGPLPRVELPLSQPAADPHEIGWLPETSYDPDCEPRPVRM